MVTATPRLHYTFADYLRYEAASRDKHEYVSGLILAMAGGTLEHGALASAVVIALGAQLRGKRCRVFDSDARVRVQASGNAFYPDASVVCGALEVDGDDPDSMVNPVVLVEVLSPSTADYDLGDKLLDYQSIPSLRHVVHVAFDERRIDVWTRSGDGWAGASYREGATAELAAIDCRLDVAEIYLDPLAPPG
jgi:Uma2 family endonuclease